MALKKGTTSRTVDLDEIPEVPEEIPRDRWGRPLITPLDGGRSRAYTRASTLGKAIEDTYHLSKWLQRSVAFGLSRRPDLIALVAAVATNEGEDRDPLDQLCEKAHEAAKGDKGANVGTAIHKLSERRDAGEDLAYLPPLLLDALDAYSRWMTNFEVLASETFVVCDPLETAGSFDRVVRLLVDLELHHPELGRVVIPAGTVMIIDIKTGKLESAKYWGPTYGVQQVVYACGVPYRHGVGRLRWEQLLGEGLAPSTDWALLLHVPSDSPQDAGLVIVDLNAAAGMADLCLEVRAARKNKTLMSEAYPVPEIESPPASGVPIVDCSVQHELMELIAQATDEAALTALWEQAQSDWTSEHSAAVRARLAELELQTEYEIEQPGSEKPAQVVALDLMAQLRAAPDGAALDALWEANQDAWTDACTRMAKARARELQAVAG